MTEKNPISISNPDIAVEWNYQKNKELTPNNVTAGSGKKVWWRCKLGHEWQATIYDRVSGTGCPYCSNRLPLIGFNDLATTHPTIAKEWHPTNNGELTPNNVTAGSGKKVWWRCKLGHEWQAMICNRVRGTGCPYCSNQLILIGFNDLATTQPEITKEWHPTKNGELKPTMVTAGSPKKVWWLLSYDDPKSGKHFDFEWQATICNRTSKNSGCPYLSGACYTGFNDLQTLRPDLA